MPTLEERVTDLDEKVARLSAETSKTDYEKPWWEAWYGAFKDNPDFDAAMERGAEYRRSQPKASDDCEAMYLLDTDHTSLIARAGAEGRRIVDRLSRVNADSIAVSVINCPVAFRASAGPPVRGLVGLSAAGQPSYGRPRVPIPPWASAPGTCGTRRAYCRTEPWRPLSQPASLRWRAKCALTRRSISSLRTWPAPGSM